MTYSPSHQNGGFEFRDWSLIMGVVSQTGSGRFPVVNKEARRSGSRREHEAVVPVNLMC